jgi:hypothetical protein
VTGSRSVTAHARSALASDLRQHRDDIEQASIAWIRDSALATLSQQDAHYLFAGRSAVAGAVEHGLLGIEEGRETSAPVPSAALTHAQHAARANVGIDCVVGAHVAIHNTLGQFVLTQTGQANESLRIEALSVLAGLHHQVVTAVTCEYMRELERLARSPTQRLADRVRRVLAGEQVNELPYDFDAWHVAIIITGHGAQAAIRKLRTGVNQCVLAVPRSETVVWVWLARTRKPPLTDIEALLRGGEQPMSVAIGEPSRGLEGFRLTHRQAQHALLIALHQPPAMIRYGENMLLAAALYDPTLARSLEDIYIQPLASSSDGGRVARQTLRAYFKAGRGTVSAAARLSVSRSTVVRRIASIERRLGRPVDDCQAELEVALRLWDLGDSSASPHAPTRHVPLLPVPHPPAHD